MSRFFKIFNFQKTSNLDEKVLDHLIEKEQKNPKFHRTKKEEDASIEFFSKHETKLREYENKIYDEVNKCFLLDDVDETIKQCEKAIKNFYDFKKYCSQKGKGGIIYFEDTWEFCHNSQNDCFSYIEKVEFLLKDYTENYNLKKKIVNLKKNLNVTLLEFIKNNPGILQTELYKNFDNLILEDIKLSLYTLSKNDKIKRIKTGRSYTLNIK